MRQPHKRSILACFGLLALSMAPLPAPAGEVLDVELNKLEQVGDVCRAFLVIENPSGAALTSIKLDLVLFDADGVIANRFALDVAPLEAEKTSVKSFDIAAMPCGEVSRILLNDVLECEDPVGPVDRCVDRIEVSSRGETGFFK